MNDYTNIRLDKTMYRADKSFSQQLEMMDPSDRYTRPLGEAGRVPAAAEAV